MFALPTVVTKKKAVLRQWNEPFRLLTEIIAASASRNQMAEQSNNYRSTPCRCDSMPISYARDVAALATG